jgi:hypothetical protein
MFLKPANFFEIFLVFLGEQLNKETQKGEKSYTLCHNNSADISPKRLSLFFLIE